MNRLFILSTMLLLGACASKPAITIDSDPTANFAAYRTYSWLGQPEIQPPLMRQRVVDGVDAHLQQKGWRKTTNGDVAVTAHVTTAQQQTLTTIYDGGPYAGWGWRSPQMGSATTYVNTYETGTLIVDLFDTRSKRAVWRGTATATVPDKPAQENALLEESLDRMFADFPPGTPAAKTK